MSDTRELERENQELSESILTAYETIEGAIELTDYQEALASSSPVRQIFELTAERVRGLLPFHATGFFQINEENGALDLRLCRPAADAARIENLIETETAAGNTHIALRDQRPMLRHIGEEHDERLLLHAICTSRRCRGLFVGIYRPGERESDRMAMLLLSLILSHCANAIESAELYALLRKTNRELAGAEEFARMRLEQTDAEMTELLGIIERLGSGGGSAVALLRRIYRRTTSAEEKRSIPLSTLLEMVASHPADASASGTVSFRFEYAGEQPRLCLLDAAATALILLGIFDAVRRASPGESGAAARTVVATATKDSKIEITIPAGPTPAALLPASGTLTAELIEEPLQGRLLVESGDTLMLSFPVHSCL